MALIFDVTGRALRARAFFARLGAWFARLFGGASDGDVEYLDDGIVLGFDDDANPVFWPVPAKEAAAHVLCLAASGSGKSMLLAEVLVEEVVANG